MSEDESKGHKQDIDDFKPRQKLPEKTSKRSTILLSLGVICALILSGMSYMGEQIIPGIDGRDGSGGDNSLISIKPLLNSGDCDAGGHRIIVGIDDDGDGVLDEGEQDASEISCNGQQGLSGPQGLNGVNGSAGEDGTQGSDGVDGIIGMNGTNGSDGSDGANGLDGTDGLDGQDGKSTLSTTRSVSEGVCLDGVIFEFGIDDDADSLLNQNETDSSLSICFETLQSNRITDNVANAGNSFSANCQNFASMNDVLYFSSYDIAFGCELWASRGLNPVRLSEINSGGDSEPGKYLGLVVAEDKIWFDAWDGTSRDLYRADDKGVELVADLAVDIAASDRLVNAENGLHLQAAGNLYNLSDGLTILQTGISNLAAARDSITYNQAGNLWLNGSFWPSTTLDSNLVWDEDNLWFLATNDGMGSELFRLDSTGLEKMSSTLGNSPGQYMGLNIIGGVVIIDAPLAGSPDIHLLGFDNTNLTLFNMNPALSSPGMSGGAVLNNGKLFFDCDSTSGTEMCSSDGTPSGTKVLADVMTGTSDSDPRDIMVVAGEVVALAKGWNGSANIGYALYSFSDTGATMLWDPQAGVGDSQAGLYGQITAAGDFLYFVAEDGTYGQELHAFAHGELSNSWIVLD